MKAKLVAVGNSKGIRLPKIVIEQCGLTGELELEVRKDHLVIRSRKSVRRGWAAAFARMRAGGDDRLLDIAAEGAASQWDETEWTW